MICCLCLNYSENMNNIFDEVEDKQEYIATMVAKHFWFEPRKDDPISTAICCHCSIKLVDFHNFYEMVESAHNRYRTTESVIIKTEDAPIDFNTLPSKHESTDVFDDELSEVPFTTQLVTTKNAGASTLLSEESQDALSQPDVAFDDLRAENDNDSEREECPDHQEVCLDTDPIDETDEKEKNKRNSQNPIEPKTRTTRSSRRLPATDYAEEENPAEIQPKPRKKRVVKEKTTTIRQKNERKPKKQKSKDKTNDSPEEQTAYKDKMKSFDTQISQYMGLHCDVCNIAAENFASLKLHMRNEHNIENGYVKCCDKKFHRRANLLYHIRHHVDPNCYSCEECNRAFSDYQSLRNHINVKHQKEEDKIYECTECSKKFAKKYLLEQHKTFKHKDRSTKCKMCNRRYDSIDELSEHNKEPCVAGIMCDICAKVIYGPAAFKRHQLDHEDGQANKEQCDLCGSWHRDKYALRKHKRRHLEPKQPHVCDICNKISPSREAMISHKRYAHSTDRSFECEFCQKCFKKALSLREHMTTHTGEVLYTCPHCPKTFNSNANMHSHRKNAHPREFEEARRRRKRVAYVKDPHATASNAKNASVLNSVKQPEDEVPDLTNIKSNDQLMIYGIN